MVFLQQVLVKIVLKQAIESQKNPYCVIWVQYITGRSVLNTPLLLSGRYYDTLLCL